MATCSNTDMMYVLIMGIVAYMWWNSKSNYVKNSGTVKFNEDLPHTSVNGGAGPSGAGRPSGAGPLPSVGGGSINHSEYDLAKYTPSADPTSNYPDGTWDSNELLPENGAIDFQNTNFLTPVKQTGEWVDALRNANHQIRSEPIIKKVNVGPWQNSTIRPDVWRESIDPMLDPVH